MIKTIRGQENSMNSTYLGDVNIIKNGYIDDNGDEDKDDDEEEEVEDDDEEEEEKKEEEEEDDDNDDNDDIEDHIDNYEQVPFLTTFLTIPFPTLRSLIA